MTSTKIIHNPGRFQLPSNWQGELSLTDRIVDQNGHAVGTGFMGQRFKVICEAKLAESVFCKRRRQAILAIIFTFGAAYCCNKKTKLFLKQKECLFITPIEIPSSKTSVEKQTEVAKVQELVIQKIEPKKEEEFPLDNNDEKNQASELYPNILPLYNDVLERIILELDKDEIITDSKKYNSIIVNARRTLNYSLVSKAWQKYFKDHLSKKKWIYIDKKNDNLIDIKFMGTVPFVWKLDPSLCKIQGPSYLFKLFALAGETTSWRAPIGAGEKAPPLNLNELQEICRLFPEASIAKHLYTIEIDGYDYKCYKIETNKSLLNFACYLYIEKEEQDIPLKAIEILLENGALVDLNQAGCFDFIGSSLHPYGDHLISLNELLDNHIASLKWISTNSYSVTITIIEELKSKEIEKSIIDKEKIEQEITPLKNQLYIISKLVKLKQLITQKSAEEDTPFLLGLDRLIEDKNSFLKRRIEKFLSTGSIKFTSIEEILGE